MMKFKYVLTSAVLVAMSQAMAVTPVKKSVKVAKQQASVSLADKDSDAPAYTITGKDSTCQIFVYSPDPKQGLHVAYLTDDERWVDVGQLCSSDYGPWGAEKKMYNPFILKAKDGTWRALWSVNDHAPQFAVAYSEDLITWRPQDYPVVKEKGVKDVAAYQMDDGTFDIYLKTAKGKRYVQASEDFRTFKEDSLEATADEILWQRDTATINGKLYQGNDFDVPAVHLNYIRSWFKALAEENAENNRALPKNEADLKALVDEANKQLSADGASAYVLPNAGEPIQAKLQIDGSKTKKISDKLMGIFFEDISRAADGGLYAEMLQNGDFEYDKDDRKRQWNAVTAWMGISSSMPSSSSSSSSSSENTTLSSENGVSKNNPHYVILGNTPIYNIGWDGISVKRGAAVEGKEGKHQDETYLVSLYAKNIDGKSKQLTVALVDKEGLPIAQSKVKVVGNDWAEYKTHLVITDKYKGTLEGKDIRFAILPKGESKVGIDLVSLKPQDTYKGHGLRRDLAEKIADLKPRFVRFPGGCMLHGQGLENIYHWKESVGPMKDRKPARNIWNYHQTRGMGFYEYFQWCEDMGAEPLPVLAAGVPCQNSGANAAGVAGQQGGIPMAEMPQYVQDVLDLVEWANGDPATSKWAKMRAEAGHPAPFNLKMIGIGNEDLISTTFEERYLMICKAVKQKYPQIEVVGTVGPFHWPSSDYVEGWKIAKENKHFIDAVDEHYYEKPGWFINHQDYYDNYDRKAPKVYLGEYAANGNNETDRALAEGIHLCSVERNGDVVEMTSYAPLLCKEGYANWNPDMIYFTNDKIRETESYQVQKMFGQHAGDIYVSSQLNLPAALRRYVGTSVVKDSKTGKTWLKVVNALPRKITIQLGGLSSKTVTVDSRKSSVFEL